MGDGGRFVGGGGGVGARGGGVVGGGCGRETMVGLYNGTEGGGGEAVWGAHLTSDE